MIRSVLVVVLLLTLFVAGCIGRFCTAKDCFRIAQVCAGPETNHWRVCRNDRCSEVFVEPPTEPGAYPTWRYVEEELPLDQFGFVAAGCIGVSTEGPDVKNGDVYTLTRWAEDGTELASYQWTATYDKVHPNGEDCDGDYFCLVTKLDESNAE